MTMTDAHQSSRGPSRESLGGSSRDAFGQELPERSSAREAFKEMTDAGLFDDLMDRIDEGGLQLTGEGGFLPEMIKAVLERGLQAELSDHLGYDKGDPAGGAARTRGTGRPRRGCTPRSATSPWTPRGIGTPRSSRGWCPRAPAGSAAWAR